MLTQDPIGLAGGVNLYSYAGSNPIAFDDPFGLCDPPGTCTQSDVPYRSRFTQLREALGRVLQKLGTDAPIRPKSESKFGNPNMTRGTGRRGYRLDPGHDDKDRGGKPGSGGDVEHINFWDYTKGKKGSGREIKGHEPVEYGVCSSPLAVDCIAPRAMPGFIVTPSPLFSVPTVPMMPSVPVIAPSPVFVFP